MNAAGRAYCGPNLGPLDEGERLAGAMTLVDAATNTWEVASTRLATGEASVETAALGDGVRVDAAYLTLEMMVVYGCDAYPASGSQAFDATALADVGGAPVAAAWKKEVYYTECAQDVSITDADDPVTITWDPTL